jgi:hypothetical protein
MEKYINRTAKLTIAQKLADLIFAGDPPLDKYSRAIAEQNDAEVEAVYIPMDLA